jgi:hypothetical protein
MSNSSLLLKRFPRSCSCCSVQGHGRSLIFVSPALSASANRQRQTPLNTKSSLIQISTSASKHHQQLSLLLSQTQIRCGMRSGDEKRNENNNMRKTPKQAFCSNCCWTRTTDFRFPISHMIRLQIMITIL